MVILQENMIDQGNNSSLIVYYTEYFLIFSPPDTKCHINYGVCYPSQSGPN